jgi:hypothetical protein
MILRVLRDPALATSGDLGGKDTRLLNRKALPFESTAVELMNAFNF